GIRRSIPRADPAHAERGAPGARVPLAERAQAWRLGGADGGRVLVGPNVRRLAAGRERCRIESEASCAGEDLAARRRVAAVRTHRAPRIAEGSGQATLRISLRLMRSELAGVVARGRRSRSPCSRARD